LTARKKARNAPSAVWIRRKKKTRKEAAIKRYITILVLSVFAAASPVFSQVSDKKMANPSQKVYERASSKSVFNRAEDWFATVGKSAEEKEKITAERNMRRAAKEAEKEAVRSQKISQSGIKKL
jgi:hypothetical protein